MNWVDVVILSILVVSVVAGVFRGALKTLFSLAGVIVGFFIATRESGAVGMVLERWVPENAAQAVGFVVVFLAIVVVFTLAGWLLRKLLKTIFLGWVDGALGGVVGFLRASIFVGILALVIEGIGSPLRAVKDSISYPYALYAGRLLLKVIPPDTLKRLDWESLKDHFELPKADDLI